MKTKQSSLTISQLLATTTVLLSMVMSSVALAGGKNHSSIDWAKVTKVKPITRLVERRIPETQCWDEQVRIEDYYDSDHSYTSTILGGIIGGAVGNAVGHRKKNKQIGTAVGAILGASIGSDIGSRDRKNRRSPARYHTEQRCDVTHHVTYEEEVVGYHVWYRYNGEKYKTRMDRKPGNKIKVRVNVQPI